MRKPKPRKVYEPKPCEYCDEPFTPKRKHAKFCSPACKVESWKDRNYIGRDGVLTQALIESVSCKYGHKGARQRGQEGQ